MWLSTNELYIGNVLYVFYKAKGEMYTQFMLHSKCMDICEMDVATLCTLMLHDANYDHKITFKVKLS
jgi:hypothetical protein